MKSFHETYTINTDPDTFWKTFLDDDYTHAVYTDGLGCERADIQDKDGDTDSGMKRTLETVQDIAAPGAIKKIVGGSVTNVEDGSFDPDSGTWTFTVTSDKMGDKLKVSGKVTAEQRDDGKTDESIEMEFDATVRFIGGQLEGFAEKQSRESWGKAADYMNSWIEEKGLAAGD